VFVKKRYLSSWVFTAVQSVHIRMNSSLNPTLKKILDPPMAPGTLVFRKTCSGVTWVSRVPWGFLVFL